MNGCRQKHNALQARLYAYASFVTMQEDLEETTPVCSAICQCLGSKADRIQGFVPQIVQVFGQIAVQDAAPMAARVQVAKTLALLHAQYGEHMGPLLAALPEHQRVVLQQLANS